MIIKNSLHTPTHTSIFGVHYRTGSPGQLGLRVAGFPGHWVAGSRNVCCLQRQKDAARLRPSESVYRMTFLSRPSSPLAVHLPTRHPSDGILPCYRQSSSAGPRLAGTPAAAAAAAESSSTETVGSSPVVGAGTWAGRRPRRRRASRGPRRLSPPRPRSRSDATAYCRRPRGDGGPGGGAALRCPSYLPGGANVTGGPGAGPDWTMSDWSRCCADDDRTVTDQVDR